MDCIFIWKKKYVILQFKEKWLFVFVDDVKVTVTLLVAVFREDLICSINLMY